MPAQSYTPQEPIFLRVARGSRRGEKVTLSFIKDDAIMTGENGHCLGTWTREAAFPSFLFPGFLSNRFLFTIRWENAEIAFQSSRRDRRRLLLWLDLAFLQQNELAMAALKKSSQRRIVLGLFILVITAAIGICFSFLSIRGYLTHWVLPFGSAMAGATTFGIGLEGLLRWRRVACGQRRHS